MQDGNRFAAHYIIHAVLKNSALDIEVFEFLEMSDGGLISRVNSITRDLPK